MSERRSVVSVHRRRRAGLLFASGGGGAQGDFGITPGCARPGVPIASEAEGPTGQAPTDVETSLPYKALGYPAKIYTTTVTDELKRDDP